MKQQLKAALAAALCLCLLAGCAGSAAPASSTPPAGSASTAQQVSGNSAAASNSSKGGSVSPVQENDFLQGLSAEQMDELESYIFQWFFFFREPISDLSEIPQDIAMLQFLCQQAWLRQLRENVELDVAGNQDSQLIYLPVSEVTQMAQNILGDTAKEISSLGTPLPYPIDEWEAHIKELHFGKNVYYVPEKDSFLVYAVFGLDLTSIDSIAIESVENQIKGSINTIDGSAYTYFFDFDEQKFPFLPLKRIE